MSTNRYALLAAALFAAFNAGAASGQTRTAPPASQPAPPPAANALNDTAKALAGAFEFSNADRDRRCTVDLKLEPAGAAGLKLEFDKDCVKVFGFVKDIAGWTIAENDFLRLLDAKGKPVLEMSEVEHGIFEVPRPGEGVLFLQSAAAVEPPGQTAEQVAGDWDLMRGGTRLCAFTLANTAAGDGAYAVTVKPGCDASVTRFAPSTWQMDGRELLVKGGGGQSWRFEQDDDRTWQRVPATRDPVSLVRK